MTAFEHEPPYDELDDQRLGHLIGQATIAEARARNRAKQARIRHAHDKDSMQRRLEALAAARELKIASDRLDQLKAAIN